MNKSFRFTSRDFGVVDAYTLSLEEEISYLQIIADRNLLVHQQIRREGDITSNEAAAEAAIYAQFSQMLFAYATYLVKKYFPSISLEEAMSRSNFKFFEVLRNVGLSGGWSFSGGARFSTYLHTALYVHDERRLWADFRVTSYRQKKLFELHKNGSDKVGLQNASFSFPSLLDPDKVKLREVFLQIIEDERERPGYDTVLRVYGLGPYQKIGPRRKIDVARDLGLKKQTIDMRCKLVIRRAISKLLRKPDLLSFFISFLDLSPEGEKELRRRLNDQEWRLSNYCPPHERIYSI